MWVPKKPIVKYLQAHILSVVKVTHRNRERDRERVVSAFCLVQFSIFSTTLCISLPLPLGWCWYLQTIKRICKFLHGFWFISPVAGQQDGETGARLLYNDFSSFGGFADFALESGSVSSAVSNSLGQLFFCLIRLIGTRRINCSNWVAEMLCWFWKKKSLNLRNYFR